MRYAGCLLIVRDAQKSKKFYEEVLHTTVTLDLGDHVVFAEGFFLLQEDSWLRLANLRRGHLRYNHHTAQIYFEVDTIDDFMHSFERNADIVVLHPVKKHPWGQYSIRFYDPDGHIVEVAESMKVVVLRYLRSGMTCEQAAEKSQFPLPFVEACKAEMNLSNE